VLLDITVTVGSSAQLCIIKAVPWFRRLVAGLSLQIPGFVPGSVHVGFVVDRVVLGQIFLPSSLVFPCQCHSPVALHSHICHLGDEH
jgi:hypothetical protein